MLNSISPYAFNWGPFTSDGYDPNENSVIHIFNFDLGSFEKLERIINFSVGRMNWAKYNLPINCMQKVVFDIRGQKVNDEIKKTIRLRIESQANTDSKYIDIEFFE